MGIRAADYQHDVDGKQGLRTRSLQRCDFSPYEAFFSMGYIYALKRAPDQRMRKADLQRKLWRIPASMFHPILDRLVAGDRITIEDDWIYPISRAEFEAKQREARERERRPRLLYTIL